jgi:exodeoxyribonuclease III
MVAAINRAQPDVVALQEVKCQPKHLEKNQKWISFLEQTQMTVRSWHKSSDTPELKGLHGVMTLTRRGEKPTMTVEGFAHRPVSSHEEEGRIATTVLDWAIIVNWYMPCSTVKAKLDFMQEVKKHCKTMRDSIGDRTPIVVIGDTNIAIKDTDIQYYGRRKAGDTDHACSADERDSLQTFLKELELADSWQDNPNQGARFSWESPRRWEGPDKLRIDHVLIPTTWLPRIEACRIHYDRMGSDHRPVILTLRETGIKPEHRTTTNSSTADVLIALRDGIDRLERAKEQQDTIERIREDRKPARPMQSSKKKKPMMWIQARGSDPGGNEALIKMLADSGAGPCIVKRSAKDKHWPHEAEVDTKTKLRTIDNTLTKDYVPSVNLPIAIAGIPMVVKAYILDDAPHDMILGWKAMTQNSIDLMASKGQACITLENGEEIRIELDVKPNTNTMSELVLYTTENINLGPGERRNVDVGAKHQPHTRGLTIEGTVAGKDPSRLTATDPTQLVRLRNGKAQMRVWNMSTHPTTIKKGKALGTFTAGVDKGTIPVHPALISDASEEVIRQAANEVAEEFPEAKAAVTELAERLIRQKKTITDPASLKAAAI